MHLLLFRQVLSEATEDNLIDLGPGSPAVVSDMANAAPASMHHVAGGGPSSPATLASRLAGLGTDGGPWALQSIRWCSLNIHVCFFASRRGCRQREQHLELPDELQASSLPGRFRRVRSNQDRSAVCTGAQHVRRHSKFILDSTFVFCDFTQSD